MAVQSITKAEQLLDSLGRVTLIDEVQVTQQLQSAFLSTASMCSLKPFFKDPCQTPVRCTFGGKDLTSVVESLGNAAIAAQLANIASNYGFDKITKREVALMVPEDHFNSIMPHMLADHIDAQLGADGLSPLREIRKDTTWVSQFNQLVTGKFFNPFGSRDDYHYAMTCLFVYQYLLAGPDMTLASNVIKSEGQVLISAWQSNLHSQNPSPGRNDLEYPAQTAVLFNSYSATGILAPTGKANALIPDFAQALQAADLMALPEASLISTTLPQVQNSIDDGTIFSNINVTNYNSVSYRLWNQWMHTLNDQSLENFWRAGIMAAASQSFSDSGTILPNQGVPFFVPAGESIHTTYGGALAAWYQNNRDAAFINPEVTLTNVITTLKSQPVTCFVPGTLVETMEGPVPIEDLAENDCILTRSGEAKQWGIRSDESVENPAPETVYGVNGEPEFFTAGHPLYTSTGLRAIDPDMARQENPWLDVGHLRVGDQLLRLNANKTDYEKIPITSISSATSKCKSVYGVHLREGLRSYHANGYLVALNYPEITAAAIARQLQEIPLAERANILQSFSTLKPIFARFGAITVMERLTKEAHSKTPLAYGGRPVDPRKTVTRDLNKTYAMRRRRQNGSMATLQMAQGSLFIDQAPVPRIKMTENSLAWSRQLPDKTWEHAHCNFIGAGNRASGFLVRTPEESCADDGSLASDHEVIPFVLAAVSPSRHQGSTATVTDTSQAETESLFSATAETKSSNVHFFSLAAGPVFNKKEPVVSSPLLSKKPQPHNDYVFALTCDPTPASQGVQPSFTLPCGNLLLPGDDAGDILWPMMQVQDFEMIREALTVATRKEVPDQTKINMDSLTNLYTYDISYRSSSIETHTYELQTPEMIISCSDEYQMWLQRPNPKDDTPFPQEKLHFTKELGMPADFVITKLFKTLQIDVLPGGEKLSGFVFPYDSEADGNRGAAHAVVGQHTSTITSLTAPSPPTMPIPVESKAVTTEAPKIAPLTAAGSLSSAMAAQPDLQLSEQPSNIANGLAGFSDDESTVTDLMTIEYNNSDVHQASQTTMINVMQWHMDEDTRRLFFGTTSKPSNLDPLLTTQLDTEIANWVHDVYAPAYICQMMTTNDGSVGTQYRFTEDDKKRINYWWTGKGSGTLARSNEYKVLDRAIQRFVTRDKYPLIKDIWLRGNGIKFSNLLFDKYTTESLAFSQLKQVNNQTGTSILTKICSIMDSLYQANIMQRPVTYGFTPPANMKPVHIEDTNSNTLTLKVMASVRGEAWFSQFWGITQVAGDKTSRDLELGWLKDALKELLTLIINKDPSIAGPFVDMVNAQIEKAHANDAAWANMSDKQRTNQLLIEFGGSLEDFIDGLCMAGKAAWNEGANLVRRMRGFGRILPAAEAAAEAAEATQAGKGPIPVTTFHESFKKSVFLVLGALAIAATAVNLKNKWSASDAAERGFLITSVMTALHHTLEVGVDALEALMRMGGKSGTGFYSNTIQVSIARKLDVYMGKTLSSDAQIMELGGKDGIFKSKQFFEAETGMLREMKTMQSVRVAQNIPAPIETIAIPLPNQEMELTKVMSDANRVLKWRRAFNIARTVLAWLGYALAVAVVVFMTWQLVKDWASMSLGQRIFGVIQLVLAAIEGGLGGVIIVLGVAWGVASALGLSAAGGLGSAVAACCTTFAALGPVLAVIAVVVLIIFFIWSSAQPTPPNDVEVWLNGPGKKWAKTVEVPRTPITISLVPESVTSSQATQTLSLTIQNTDSKPAVSQGLRFGFTTGPTRSTLFWDMYAVTQGTTGSETPGTVTMETTNTTASMSINNIPSDTSVKVNTQRTTIAIMGPTVVDAMSLNQTQDLTLAAGEKIILQIHGKIWCDDGSSGSITVSQSWQDDSWNNTLNVDRSKGT